MRAIHKFLLGLGSLTLLTCLIIGTLQRMVWTPSFVREYAQGFMKNYFNNSRSQSPLILNLKNSKDDEIVRPLRNNTVIIHENKTLTGQQFEMAKPFVFMFGTTAVQVNGSIPSKCSLLFIGIHSGPNMASRRNAMRATYLKGITHFIVYRFILGNPTDELLEENTVHKDMVFINQTERYTALDSVLPYKAASIMVMASRMTVKPSWLLKTDDDSLVNLPEVVRKLSSFKENSYYGSCFVGIPIRDTSSKWYVTKDLWPEGKNYPKFCVGAGYFMSSIAYDCAAKLIQSPSHKYFPREDVSAGIMMSECNINATDLPGVYYLEPPKTFRDFLIQHYVKTPEHVHQLWKLLMKT